MKTIEIYFTEIYHNERIHFAVEHAEFEIVERMLVIHRTVPDEDGLWTDVYPISTIDWFRWRVEDEETKTDETGQPVQ